MKTEHREKVLRTAWLLTMIAPAGIASCLIVYFIGAAWTRISVPILLDINPLVYMEPLPVLWRLLLAIPVALWYAVYGLSIAQWQSLLLLLAGGWLGLLKLGYRPNWSQG